MAGENTLGRVNRYEAMSAALAMASLAAAAVGFFSLGGHLFPCSAVLVLFDTFANVFGGEIHLSTSRWRRFKPPLTRDVSLQLDPRPAIDTAAYILMGPASIAPIALSGSALVWLMRLFREGRNKSTTAREFYMWKMRDAYHRAATGGILVILSAFFQASGLWKVLGFGFLYMTCRTVFWAIDDSMRYGVRYDACYRKRIERWPSRTAEIALGLFLTQVYPDLTGGVYGVILLAGLTPVVVHSAGMLEDVRAMYCGTIRALSKAVESKDPHRLGRRERTAVFAAVIASKALLGEEMATQAYWAGLAHDLGNMGVSDKTLLQNGPLQAEEYAEVMRHCEVGHSLLSFVPFMKGAAVALKHHHERWDGSGYPDGLSKEKIPVLARIVGLADALEALTSGRSYRDALSLEEASELMTGSDEARFDHALVSLAIQTANEEADWGSDVFRSHYSIDHRW